MLCEVAFVVKSLKEVLSPNLIRNIYFTKFHPLLRFGILFCGGAGGELTARILRIHKQVITWMVRVSWKTSCRQLFKELNILTLVSLYITEVICYIRKHHQFIDLNSNIHAHNTQRKMDIHIQSHNTDLYKRSVKNMDTKLYNKLPGTQNKQTAIRPLRRNWNHFFFFFCISISISFHPFDNNVYRIQPSFLIISFHNSI